MARFQDLSGKPFGKWTVLERAESGCQGQARFKCLCECGNVRLVYAQSLRNGRSKSCGRCPNPNLAEHLPDGTTVLTLERRNGDTFQCFIATADYPAVQKYRWWVVLPRGGGCYAQTSVPETGKQIFVHQLLSGIKDIDHADRNGLNNLRSNLRPATRQQQQANHKKHSDGTTSPYRGVSWHKETKKFRAAIVFSGKQKHLGLFAEEADAARAFNKAATEYFGEFASLNEIPDRDTVSESECAPALAAAPQVSTPHQMTTSL
jgi:hypothetical protein